MDLETMSLDEIWAEIDTQAKQHPEYIEDINAIYTVNLTGEEEVSYSLSVRDGKATITNEAATDADCTLTMSVGNFKKLLQGNLNTATAFMTGKLKVKGNIGLALKLENSLKKFSFNVI